MCDDASPYALEKKRSDSEESENNIIICHGLKLITALTADTLNIMSSLRNLLATLVLEQAPTTPIGSAKKIIKPNKISSIRAGSCRAAQDGACGAKTF